jgi:GNAT superfamily N-acetyltransferase
MSMIIEPLTFSYIEPAADLFCAAYHQLRQQVPVLDEKNGQRERIGKMLERYLTTHPGVAAWENGKMLGYMTGMYIDELLGIHKGVYCPEWSHCSVTERAFDIYRRMYQVIGQQWMEAGCLTHTINFLQHARDAREAFCWNGFGYICIDAMRPFEQLEGIETAQVEIRPITENDIAEWLPLRDRLNQHLSHSPVFKPWNERETEQSIREPDNHAWMALSDGKAVGYMQIAPNEHGAAWIVNGERKFAVNGAFVLQGYRARGIASALLNTIMQWGIDAGMLRCSVDFEATNIEASRFWLQHFQSVCTSMIRRLDENITSSIRL